VNISFTASHALKNYKVRIERGERKSVEIGSDKNEENIIICAYTTNRARKSKKKKELRENRNWK
jgi:hypothetical protein